jgi:DNA-binding transcriptional ArsR family regulator
MSVPTLNPMAADQVVELGRLLGDPTRVALLDALFDGRAYAVTELRQRVGVAPSTASQQLARLLDGGLVALEVQGRHHYYRLRGPEVAAILEPLFDFGLRLPVKQSSRVPADLAFARTCYDHLAGTVAVGLTDRLVVTGAVKLDDGNLSVTRAGRGLFTRLGLDVDTPSARRPVVRSCLDWSERRPHLAGALPARLLGYMLEEKWFTRKASGRALWLTDTGRSGLQAAFGYDAP